jgi:hypothetical protein
MLRLQMEERTPIWKVALNTLNKQPRTADKGVTIQLRFWGRCKQLITVNTYHVMRYELGPWTWIDPLIGAQDRDR